MAMAARTWTGEWWKYGGGGNAWHGFTYDAELDQLYIGTGNGAPWNHKVRSPGGGDNLKWLFHLAAAANRSECGIACRGGHGRRDPGYGTDVGSTPPVIDPRAVHDSPLPEQ